MVINIYHSKPEVNLQSASFENFEIYGACTVGGKFMLTNYL